LSVEVASLLEDHAGPRLTDIPLLSGGRNGIEGATDFGRVEDHLNGYIA
jgi:hypothetical protein